MNRDKSQNTKALNTLVRCGAIAYFAMPICYIGMFLIFGILLSIPHASDISDKIAYIASQQNLLSLAYVLGYLIFGGLLLVAVQATHAYLIKSSSHMLNLASAFGLIWVVLMMCSGMLALVGMNTMIELFSQGNPHSETLFYIQTTVVNGLGGGIELVGGLWVLFLSVFALRTNQLSKGVNFFGCLVGMLGIGTLYLSLPSLKEAFGLCQIIWFILMGIAMFRHKNEIKL
ncbi:hypothetical protein [Alteromonas flava]|uniref:hypothetical protein n=1 Tax=Alteromonas flava TaxID=2048003 RepID=UPI000C28A2B3|nr:hypothetical protein [Alteromonas flava]